METCGPIPTPIVNALELVVHRLSGIRHIWALTGSLGLRLQDLPIEVHDIDLQTTHAGAYAIERCFKDAVIRLVSLSKGERIRSHFGSLSIGEVRVEIMGDLQKKLPHGGWSAAPNLSSLLRSVSWRGCTVPVLDLAYELEAYRLLGREDTARLIEAWLRRHQTRSQ